MWSLQQQLQESEDRADRVLRDKSEHLSALKRDFESVVAVTKQEITRKYQTELIALKRLVIELKNKYSDALEDRAQDCERKRSVSLRK